MLDNSEEQDWELVELIQQECVSTVWDLHLRRKLGWYETAAGQEHKLVELPTSVTIESIPQQNSMRAIRVSPMFI